jgi:predicted GH43/DUF377 family glycosyl hydrolase
VFAKPSLVDADLSLRTLEYHILENLTYNEETTPIKPDPVEEFPDLETLAQDFVLDVKRIEIPGYPGSFNPTITRWNGELLLCFRIRTPYTGETNKIGLNWLDEDFNLIGETKILDIRTKERRTPTKEQDPRLIVVEGKLYIIYSNTLDITERETRRMFLGEVQYDGDNFFVENPECMTYFENEKTQRWEKNWVPFDHNGQLHLAYTLIPHRILYPVLGTEECETVASSWGSLTWNWGQMRGGTPALKIDDQYLAFFHSSKNMQTVHSEGKNIAHYFMGAYTFSAEPPFVLTAISPEPIVGKKFYNGPAYKTWKPLRVVFPSGYVHDDKHIWVTYGRQDFEIWVVKIDKKGLLESLVPVTSVVKPT